MVVDGSRAAENPFRYRVLVPYLAKTIYHAAMGHVGSWNPISFSMLVVNSGFCDVGPILFGQPRLKRHVVEMSDIYDTNSTTSRVRPFIYAR
jgi:hypothetical protein